MDEATKQLVLDYQQLLGVDWGKRILDDLANALNFNSKFDLVIQSGLPEYTGFQLGKREAYLYILEMTMKDPDVVVQEVAETE